MSENDLLSQRELEVIQHALKQLYEDVSVMNDHQSDAEFTDYLHEIKTIQDRISDTRDKLAELSEIQQKQANLYTGLINVLDKQMMDLIEFKENYEGKGKL